MNVAVLGAGAMGKNHARVLASLRGARLSGIFDPIPEAALSAATSFGCVVYPTLDAVLRDEHVEAVVVATPTSTHCETALAALEAGKHVLVEKPLAATYIEAATIAGAARKAARTLAVGHVERHNPVVAFTREALARGDFGRLFHASSRRVSNLPGRIRDVGAVFDLAVHDIDVLRYLVGAPVTRVYAVTGTYTSGLKGEDHAVLLLNFANGVSASVEVNWLTPMKVRRVGLTASMAFVTLDYLEQRAIVSSSTFPRLNEADLFQTPLDLHERIVQLKRQEPLALELADFLAAASGRIERPLVGGDDGAEAVRIAEAAVRSGREERPITFV